MKPYLKILGAAAVVLLAACTGKKEVGFGDLYNSDTTPLVVSLTEDQTTFGPEAWSGEVSFAANFWWDVAISYPGEQYQTDWLTLTPQSAFGTQPVTMELLRNISKSDRAAELTFTSHDDPSFSQTVTIVQKASEPLFELSRESISANLLGDDYPLEMTTTERWETLVPDADQTWLSVAPASGERGIDIPLTVTIQPNGTGENRSSTITVRSAEDNSLLRTITVTQSAVFNAPVLTVTNSETFIASFTPADGVQFYMLDVTKEGESTPFVSVRIDQDGRTTDYTYDLTTIGYGAYVGAITLNVASYLTATVSMPSNDVVSNNCFASGSGTSASPFGITAIRHFKNIPKALSANFLQGDDLDFNNATGYVPIGASATASFKGTYDGGGKTISHLIVSATAASSFGAFGYVAGGTVKNLTLSECSMSVSTPSAANEGHALVVGTLSAGGLVDNCNLVDCTLTTSSNHSFGGVVGVNYEGTVSNCSATGGSITLTKAGNCGGIVGVNGIPGQSGTSIVDHCVNNMKVAASTQGNTDVGGVVGYNLGTIRYCHNMAAVEGQRFIGGICSGPATPADISDKFIILYCRNSGPVTFTANANGNVGGMAGRATNQTGPVIRYCYNSGAISSSTSTTYTANVGGIVGAQGSAVVQNCYNTGAISCASTGTGATTVGGITGNSAASNCYNTGDITGVGTKGAITTSTGGAAATGCYYLSTLSVAGAGTALSAADMNLQAKYVNWDFTTPVWQIAEGVSPPTLAGNPY